MFNISTGTPAPITDKEFRAMIAPAVPPRGYQKDSAFLAQFDVVVPPRAERPTYNAQTHKLEPDALPTLVGGEWVLGGTLVAYTPEERMTAAAQECSRRIYAIADETAQMNMASMASAGLMSTDQMDAWKQALFWVGQMRSTWRGLAADTTKDITDDVNWPDCPVAAAALADGF